MCRAAARCRREADLVGSIPTICLSELPRYQGENGFKRFGLEYRQVRVALSDINDPPWLRTFLKSVTDADLLLARDELRRLIALPGAFGRLAERLFSQAAIQQHVRDAFAFVVRDPAPEILLLWLCLRTMPSTQKLFRLFVELGEQSPEGVPPESIIMALALTLSE